MKIIKFFFAVGALIFFMGNTFAQTEIIDHPNEAWVLLTHNDQRPNTRVALISGWRGESEIVLEVVYDEGAGFDINKGIKVTNGEITTPTKYVGSLAKLGTPETHTVKIKRTDMNKPVTIQWFGGKAVTIPGTSFGVSRWQKLPNTPNFEKIVAGANRFIAIDHDRQVYEWNYTNSNWSHISDHEEHFILADDTAIDMFNAIWVVHQDENKIFRYRARMTSSSDRSISADSHSTGAGMWDEFPHPGQGVTVKKVVAGGTRVLIIDTEGNLHEYNFIEKRWEKPFNIGGDKAVVSAAVDRFNSLWAIGGINNNRIYRKKYGEQWKKMDGYAREIFAASRRVMITGTDGQQYEWNFKTDRGWTRAGVYPKSTAVDLSGVIYYIETKGSDTGAVKSIYYRKEF